MQSLLSCSATEHPQCCSPGKPRGLCVWLDAYLYLSKPSLKTHSAHSQSLIVHKNCNLFAGYCYFPFKAIAYPGLNYTYRVGWGFTAKFRSLKFWSRATSWLPGSVAYAGICNWIFCRPRALGSNILGGELPTNRFCGLVPPSYFSGLTRSKNPMSITGVN